MNTRGLPLNTADLLKSENIGVIQDESNRLLYARMWRDIENDLGREELGDVIAFIRTIQIKEKAQLSIYDEYRRVIFEKGLLKRGREFIDYLKEMANIYSDKVLEASISADAATENEYKNIVTLLKKFVPFLDWIPPLLAFYYKFRTDRSLIDFVCQLEKKVILEWVTGFSSTERTTSLNRIIKLIESESEAQKVVDNLLVYRGEERVVGTPARMLDYSNKSNVESTLINRLDDSQFYSIYGGKLAKYILMRIDMKYWEMENFPGYPGTVTVEHVLPQSPDKDSKWVEIFSEQERKDWTNRIGNLVLLSGNKNSKAQNYDFDRKKAVYFKGKSTPFRITKWVEAKDKWTSVELKERHQQLLNDAKEIFLGY